MNVGNLLKKIHKNGDRKRTIQKTPLTFTKEDLQAIFTFHRRLDKKIGSRDTGMRECDKEMLRRFLKHYQTGEKQFSYIIPRKYASIEFRKFSKEKKSKS